MKRLIIAVIILSIINSIFAMNPDEQLLDAAKTGNLQLAQQAIENKANIETSNRVRSTPLNMAAHRGHVDVVRLLLANNANIDAHDCDGWTPLHAAAHYGHVDIVKLLLDKNANIKACDGCGWTSLHHAAYWGRIDVVKLLLDYPSKSYIQLLKKLQKDKTSLFFYLPKDITESVLPLYLHAPNPLEKINMLQVRTDNGKTTLDVAIMWDRSEVASLLKEKEAFYKSQLQSKADK